MSLLPDFPDELLLKIVEELPLKEDLKALALASKRFAAISQAALLSVVSIRGTGNVIRAFQLVRTLLYRPDLASNVQSLHLDVPALHAFVHDWHLITDKAIEFVYSLGLTNPEAGISWAGLVIALLPSLRRLSIFHCLRGCAPLQYETEPVTDKASFLDTLFLNFTSNDLSRIPGLQSVTDITIRGDAGDPLDWKIATLPQLRHLEIPGTNGFSGSPYIVVSKLLSLHFRCSIRALRQCSPYLDITDFFADFENLTRLQLTLSNTASDSPEGNPADFHPPAAVNDYTIATGSLTGSFATLFSKLEPLANKLEALDIQLDLSNGDRWLKFTESMASLATFTQLKHLQLPQEALPLGSEASCYDLPPQIEEIEVYRATPTSAAWINAVLGYATELPQLRRMTIGFRAGFFPALEGWWRASATEGENLLLQKRSNVDVLYRIDA